MNSGLLAITCAIFLLFMNLSPASAQTLTPPQEERFNKLALEVRCVVCQSEPVATSQAKIAIDMRGVIRQRIAAGDSDKQIRQYFADHYGENVLLRPQFNGATIALWGAPFILLGFGALLLSCLFSNRKSVLDIEASPKPQLTDEINKALRELEK